MFRKLIIFLLEEALQDLNSHLKLSVFLILCLDSIDHPLDVDVIVITTTSSTITSFTVTLADFIHNIVGAQDFRGSSKSDDFDELPPKEQIQSN